MFGSLLQTVGRLRNFGGIFSYLTSRWALATFAAAIILNRAQFYASSREHLRIKWQTRLAIYLPTILAFSYQMVRVLEAMRCQTSPKFSQYRYGDPLKNLSLDFGGEGGFLYQLSSTLLFWEDDATCCATRNMSIPALSGDTSQLRGSMSLLFGFFLTLCSAQLLETIACSLQGLLPVPETGMTIFEHSLAFAECEAMISSVLGFGFFGLPSSDNPGPSSATSGNAGPTLSRADVLQRLNVPPEVLLVCVITCFSHISSAILATTGKRSQVRLINTGIWACCYMGAFLWSFFRVFMNPIESLSDLGVLRFPTVCVVGFVPHLVILVGITGCGIIYGLAFLFTVTSVPHEVGEHLSIRQRIAWTYHNLQANVQFSQATAIRVKMSEDFYTALLKVGFNVLTAASDAVYLNEGSRVQVAQTTWIERKRLDELAASVEDYREKRRLANIPSELLGDQIAKGVEFTDQQNLAISPSPYARERKSKTRGSKDNSNGTQPENGLGISQRKSRMQLTFDFINGMFWLWTTLNCQLIVASLTRIGIERKPVWLLKAAGAVVDKQKNSPADSTEVPDTLDFYVLRSDGSYSRPSDPHIDVEREMRRKFQHIGSYTNEENLGNNVYSWWRSGGWFGDVDDSGEYEQQADDDDTSSVVSMSTDASASDAWSDMSEEDGRRTPTQEHPRGVISRERTPGAEGGLDLSSLSRLLNPQSSAEREEARMLSYSLQSTRPMTRSQYRRTTNRQRAELLMGPHISRTSIEEEERDLEQFILDQRSKARARDKKPGDWQSGAEGMGETGPQCVVCQSSPRTILVWPCGCLSMCDDCRVGLAARNYNKCICCRTDIAAYSRLYVP